LNNIKFNDYLNVIIHSLLHIPALRDYLLISDFKGKEPELLKRFAGLARKIWNPRLFKAQVSPHEFLQEVARVSGGKYKITEQGDPVEFLGWILNRLHIDMGGSKKRNSSEPRPCLLPYFLYTHGRLSIGVIYSTFQGDLRIETQQVIVKPDAEGNERPHFDIDRGMLSFDHLFANQPN
jgi:U4/U6.U5 tri-snRNP-associated protein 2